MQLKRQRRWSMELTWLKMPPASSRVVDGLSPRNRRGDTSSGLRETKLFLWICLSWRRGLPDVRYYLLLGFSFLNWRIANNTGFDFKLDHKNETGNGCKGEKGVTDDSRTRSWSLIPDDAAKKGESFDFLSIRDKGFWFDQ